MKQEIISLTKAKAKLLELARFADEEGRSFVFTRDGEPVGAFIPMNEYEEFVETLDVLEDSDLMLELKAALSDERAGRLWDRDKSGKWTKLKKAIKKKKIR